MKYATALTVLCLALPGERLNAIEQPSTKWDTADVRFYSDPKNIGAAGRNPPDLSLRGESGAPTGWRISAPKSKIKSLAGDPRVAPVSMTITLTEDPQLRAPIPTMPPGMTCNHDFHLHVFRAAKLDPGNHDDSLQTLIELNHRLPRVGKISRGEFKGYPMNIWTTHRPPAAGSSSGESKSYSYAIENTYFVVETPDYLISLNHYFSYKTNDEYARCRDGHAKLFKEILLTLSPTADAKPQQAKSRRKS